MTAQPTPASQPIAPVVRAAEVARPPAEAFAVFTQEIGSWWPLPTHGMFGERSGGLFFRDGRLVEVGVDGAEVTWGEVREWDPPRRFVMSWHPGREAGDASEVEVAFEPSGTGTRVVVEHRGWAAFGAEAMRRRHGYVGPNAWGYVLDHFADLAEPRPDAADLAELAAAYERFFTEADRGDFGPAPEGEWDADQVLAHVALSDAATIAVSHGLIHGETQRFANLDCHDPGYLRQWIDAAGDRAGLITRGREQAGQVLAILRRLSPEQLATEVPCHLIHDGEVVLDGPRPWAAMSIGAQAAVHLPAHTGQLADLRPGSQSA